MMSEEETTAVVQRYLEELDGEAPAEPIIRGVCLDRSVRRLQELCANLLYRSYPSLMQPPVNLQPDELLDAVVERLPEGSAGGPSPDRASNSSPWLTSTCGTGSSMTSPDA